MAFPSGTDTFARTRTPIPEARAYGWEDLLTPTRQASLELLEWLSAACDTSKGLSTDEQLSTSLLLSGARGSGKTTVLLSAELALRDPRLFVYGTDAPKKLERDEALLQGPEHSADRREALFRGTVCKTLLRLQPHITWMEPLDLEPLPPRANLLATLLVRVRSALEKTEPGRAGRGTGGRYASSLLQESAESAWGTLDQLVRDASFMWEDITSNDSRLRSEMQIRASEIFISFRRRFSEVMEDVSRSLAMPRFGADRDQDVILVLPIDNVDRSVEHLYNIVKLTRMVTSRRLWFVLAAGHQEFQLFMERSFQKELITSGQAGIGRKGQDETLAIARRQAATTLRRALPPSYRIEIEPVAPETAWSFAWKSTTPGEQRPLCELLKMLKLPQRGAGASSRPGPRLATEPLDSFADLFDLRPRLAPDVAEAFLDASLEGGEGRFKMRARVPGERTGPRLVLTHAARLALTLPARTLQDLWHAAWREAQDTREPDDGEKAVRVAREMLRNAVDESDLPAWASQLLLNRILREDVQGRTVLDLTGKRVSRTKRTTLSDVIDLKAVAADGHGPGGSSAAEGPSTGGVSGRDVLLSELHLRHFQDVLLVLNDPDTPGNSAPMPANVCGWFMLLHDLLMRFEQPRVLNLEVTPAEMSPELVVTLHELWVGASPAQPLVQLDFWWSPPTWNTYIEFAIFTAQWKGFLHGMRELVKLHTQLRSAGHCALLFRFIQAAWVENVCTVAGCGLGRWDWSGEDGVLSVSAALKASLQGGESGAGERLRAYETRVRRQVGQLLGTIQALSQGYDRLWVARAWLEQSLPLLALPEFAPDPGLSALLSWEEEAGDEEEKKAWRELVAHWRSRAPRLTRSRQNLVRSVAARSSASEALLHRSGGGTAGTARLLHEWLDQVDRAWFRVMDADVEGRRPGVLKAVRVPGSQSGEPPSPHEPSLPEGGLHS
jgi:hypothetical protein